MRAPFVGQLYRARDMYTPGTGCGAGRHEGPSAGRGVPGGSRASVPDDPSGQEAG
ncbi:hypothetical protein SAMN04489832_5573 [Micromonospora cremea]|uniref:Uncharacterized protein n=1 Tax=Micromonospora cremea TaxID=709881 RepID=A0A1N6AI92_9ACTN|nr:hypothetical protein SAMN04489832_5573 [Micromonospora cremea]